MTDERVVNLAPCPFCATGWESFMSYDCSGEDPDGTDFNRVMVECKHCHLSAPLQVWPRLPTDEGEDDAR